MDAVDEEGEKRGIWGLVNDIKLMFGLLRWSSASVRRLKVG